MLGTLKNLRKRILPGLVLFLFGSAVYLFAFPQPNVIYPAVVLLHVVLGAIGLFFFIPALIQCLRSRNFASAGWFLMTTGGVIGLVLIYTGTLRSDWKLLYLHIILGTAAVGILAAKWAGHRGWLVKTEAGTLIRTAATFALLAAVGAGCWYLRTTTWQKSAVIQNPSDSPETMAGEG